MYRLRTKWSKRGVAVLLLTSLLPVTFVMTAHADRHSSSFADWVFLQLRDPADQDVVQALETAMEGRARSLESFLVLFVEAYEAQGPARPLAHAFSARDLSNDALISYLQGRFLGFVGEAVLLRLSFAATQVAAKEVVKRGSAASGVADRFDLHRHVGASLLPHATAPVFVLAIRLLCAAQPLGP